MCGGERIVRSEYGYSGGRASGPALTCVDCGAVILDASSANTGRDSTCLGVAAFALTAARASSVAAWAAEEWPTSRMDLE